MTGFGDVVVSVLVITRNHENYINKALDSILSQQTKFRFEILVGDDASTDRTREIILDYSTRYPDIFRLFFHDENIGTTKNSYCLMTHARGKYLASCEGDDFWIDNDKLEQQVRILEENPEYIGCAHKVRLVDREGKTLRYQYIDWISHRKHYTQKDFKGIILPGHGSTLLRRNIFRYPDHDYSIMWKASPWIGDRTSNLLFLSKGSFYKIDRVMSCYRYIAQSNGDTVTSKIYFSSEAIKTDYEYTCRLERYANEVLQIDAGFGYHKAELFLTQLKRGLIGQNSDDKVFAKRIFFDIRRENKQKWMFLILWAMVKRIKVKIIRSNPRIFLFSKKGV